MSRRAALKLALALLAAGGVFALLRQPEIAALASPARIQEWLASTGAFAPLALIGLMTLAVVVTPIPSLPIDLAAGASFGPWLGTLYTALGALLGGGICFAAARYFGGGFVQRLAKGHILACSQCSDRALFWLILAARLLPIVSFDLVSYAAGLTRMTPARFLLATGIGMLPTTFLLNLLGQSAVLDAKLSLALGALVGLLLFALPRWIERRNPFGLMRFFRHAKAA